MNIYKLLLLTAIFLFGLIASKINAQSVSQVQLILAVRQTN